LRDATDDEAAAAAAEVATVAAVDVANAVLLDQICPTLSHPSFFFPKIVFAFFKRGVGRIQYCQLLTNTTTRYITLFYGSRSRYRRRRHSSRRRRRRRRRHASWPRDARRSRACPGD